jgi:large subunit ribosomal protein L16
MLSPKRQKHRKQFRGTWRRIAVKGSELNFGNFGIKTVEAGWITDRQIEACRVVLARATRKSGKYWMRLFPDKPFTKKPPEVTMGSGKGDVSHFVASVIPGRVLYEIDGLTLEEVKKIHKNLSSKLPLKTILSIKQ